MAVKIGSVTLKNPSPGPQRERFRTELAQVMDINRSRMVTKTGVARIIRGIGNPPPRALRA